MQTVVPQPREARQSVHRRRNVFVVGMDEYQRTRLAGLTEAADCRFHTLLPMNRLRGVTELPAAELVAEAERRLDEFGDDVDAILSFLDFPAIEIATLLQWRHDLRGPTLEAILRCNHKYWSRRLQAEAAPECIPPFGCFDPFDEGAYGRLDVPVPMWIKPLNGWRSHLGFRVADEADFRAGSAAIAAEMDRLSEPLEYFMARAAIPDAVARRGSRVGLAEGIIGGAQCTVEGYVFDGEPHAYGVVDSIREPNRSTFQRYQYPSRLPEEVRDRMGKIACRVMSRIGFDNGAFNMEFFYDRAHDQVWLLEINPRLSLSHCELFEKVDGLSHQIVAVDIALGRRPRLTPGQGPYKAAAKYFVRAHADARVERVPSAAEIAAVERAVPGTTVELDVEPGMRLSDLTDQDSYSYELGSIWIGGEDTHDLNEKHDEVLARLDLRLSEERPS